MKGDVFYYMKFRFSKTKNLRFEDQTETSPYSFRGLTFGKLCSVLKFKALYNKNWFIMSQNIDPKSPIE